jgi:hypothetical protein
MHNILRRGVPATIANSKKGSAEAIVNRRIEVTVERETVTMLVRGQPKENQDGPASGKDRPESDRLELPPPAPANEETTPATTNQVASPTPKTGMAAKPAAMPVEEEKTAAPNTPNGQGIKMHGR